MSASTHKLLWTFTKAAFIFALVWIGHLFYPNEKWNWLLIVAYVFTFEWFVKPQTEQWLKNTVKQAIRQKQAEDDED